MAIALSQTGDGVAPKQVGLTYNDAGQLTELNRFGVLVVDPTNPSGAIATSAYGYDLAGRLKSLAHTVADDPITYQWQYDNLNRVTNATSSIDDSTDYTYDDTNQLLTASATNESYAYDDNGNRISNTTGMGNRLSSDGTYTYLYDQNGNLCQRTTISNGDLRVFLYDFRNRLIEVADQTGGMSGPWPLDVKYDYDTFNRLVSRTVYDPATNTASLAEKYIYDGDHVVMDFAGAGTAAPTLSKRFLYGPAVDQILAQEDMTKALAANDRTLWLLGDNQGTTRDVVDNTGTLVTNGHITYDAFGQVLTSGPLPTDMLYTGRYLDPLTGLQYNRARWYDPGTGRWISEDPIEFAGDPSNLYRYVGNEPTDGTDPSGLDRQIRFYWAHVFIVLTNSCGRTKELHFDALFGYYVIDGNPTGGTGLKTRLSSDKQDAALVALWNRMEMDRERSWIMGALTSWNGAVNCWTVSYAFVDWGLPGSLTGGGADQ